MTGTSRLSPAELGDLGEDDFKRWCSAAGLTATKSMPDRMGWDFIVEQDSHITRSAPLDEQYSFKKAFVQIKSSRTNNKKFKCKLSSAHRLATTTLPSFIIYLTYNDTQSLQEAYGLHLGPPEFEKILKQIRLNESIGAKNEYTYIYFSKYEMQKLPIDGNGIEQFLFGDIDDLPTYCIEKSQSLKLCGYDEGSFSGSISFAENISIDDVVDLSLGLTPELDVNEFTISKRRFGITLPHNDIILHNAKLTIITDSIDNVKMYAYSKKLGRRARTELQVHAPAIPDLKQDHLKFRFSNDFIDAIASFKTSTISFKITPDINRTYNVHDATNILNFLSILLRDDAMVHLSGKFIDAHEKAENVNGFSSIIDDLYGISSIILNAAIRSSLSDELLLQISELEKFAKENETMIAILLRSDLGIEVTFNTHHLLEASSYKIVFPICISLSRFVYVGALVCDAAVIERTEAICKLKTISSRIEIDGIDQTGSDCVVETNRLVKSVASQLEQPGRCVFSVYINLSEPVAASGHDR